MAEIGTSYTAPKALRVALAQSAASEARAEREKQAHRYAPGHDALGVLQQLIEDYEFLESLQT